MNCASLDRESLNRASLDRESLDHALCNSTTPLFSLYSNDLLLKHKIILPERFEVKYFIYKEKFHL